MPASTYLANALYNHVYRNTSYTSPTQTYVALFTSSASLAALKAGTLTNEVSGGAYARVAVTWGSPTDGDGAATTTTFTTASAGWGTIRYAAIMDASTAGNVLEYGQLTSDVTINTGNTFQFNASAMTATVD